MDEDYLIHYGVKGMRWGVRRARPFSGRTGRTNPKKKKQGAVSKFASKKANEAKKAVADRHARAKDVREFNKLYKKAVKNPRKLTDAELEKVIKRVDRERTLQSIQNDLQTKRGKTMSRSILEDSGKTIAKSVLIKGGTYAVNYGIKKATDSKTQLDWKDVADFVAPVNKKKDKKDDD